MSVHKRVPPFWFALGAAALGSLGTAAVLDASSAGSAEPQTFRPDALRTGTGQGARFGADYVETVTESSSSLDPTILTTFLPVTAFDAVSGTIDDDSFCEFPSTSTGTTAAPILLPDGAVIRGARAFVRDDSAGNDITLQVWRHRAQVPALQLGVPSASNGGESMGTTTTSGTPGSVVLRMSGLDLRAGHTTTGSILTGLTNVHTSYSLVVYLFDSVDTQLCGAEVDYQVPAPADPGTTFFPVTPYRAYDSRLEMAPVADGRIGNGQSRVVPVDAGRDTGSGAIVLPNAITTNATAVAFTITIVNPAGAGFLFVAPGDATQITASTINWDGSVTGAVANSSIVPLDASRQIKVFAGGTANMSTQFVVDITGYYATAPYPNMAN